MPPSDRKIRQASARYIGHPYSAGNEDLCARAGLCKHVRCLENVVWAVDHLRRRHARDDKLKFLEHFASDPARNPRPKDLEAVQSLAMDLTKGQCENFVKAYLAACVEQRFAPAFLKFCGLFPEEAQLFDGHFVISSIYTRDAELMRTVNFLFPFPKNFAWDALRTGSVDRLLVVTSEVPETLRRLLLGPLLARLLPFPGAVRKVLEALRFDVSFACAQRLASRWPKTASRTTRLRKINFFPPR